MKSMQHFSSKSLFAFALFFLALIPLNSFSQKILIPYRAGNQWGLADTTGKVVIQPQYDTIVKFGSAYGYTPNLYQTRKNGHFGAIYNQTEIIKPVLPKIILSQKHFIYGVYGYKKYMVYSLKGQLLFKDTIREMGSASWEMQSNDKKAEIFVVHFTNGKQSLIRYNFKTDQIQQWIIPKCDEFQITEMKLVEDQTLSNSSTPRVDPRLRMALMKRRFDDSYLPTDPNNWHVTITQGQTKSHFKLSYVVKNDAFTLTPAKPNLNEEKDEGEADYPEEMATDYYAPDGRGNAGTKGGGPYNSESTIGSAYLSMRLGTLFQHIKWFDNPDRTKGRWFDTMYQVKVPEHSDLKLVRFDSNDGNWMYFKNNLIDRQISCPNYALYQQNNLWGIITDNAITSANYVTVRGIRDRFGRLFIVSEYNSENQLKYGIINEKGEEIIPVECDTLIFDAKPFLSLFAKFIMVNNGKSYIMGREFKPLLALAFDSIIQPRNQRYILDHAYNGYLNDKVIFFEVYNYQIRSISTWLPFTYQIADNQIFADYSVWELRNRNGNFVGYADKKGFYYFKD